MGEAVSERPAHRVEKFRFGTFELDPDTGSLSGPSGPVALRRQTFRLLEALLEHAPALVDHHTLLDEVWGRTALSPNVLPQAISELRQALGDTANDSKYIETKHRRGYRIVPPVERIHAAADAATPNHAVGADRSRRAALLAGAFVVLALAGTWWWQGADERWLENELLPAVEAKVDTDVTAAWRLVRDARKRRPNDARLEQLWLDLTLPIQLESMPDGARVEVSGYDDGPEDWVEIGTTPVDARLPLSPLRFRITKPGFSPLLVAPSVLPFPEPFRLHPADETPEGMVFVPEFGSVVFVGLRLAGGRGAAPSLTYSIQSGCG